MPGSPYPWVKHIRSQLLTRAPVLKTLLGRAPVANDWAIYTAHLSALANAEFPAVTLHFAYEMHPVVATAMMGNLYVDVWTWDQVRQVGSPAAVGLTGLWAIYGPIRSLLHKADLLQAPNPWSSATHEVSWLRERRADAREFDEGAHLFHLAAEYAVVLREVDWCPPLLNVA